MDRDDIVKYMAHKAIYLECHDVLMKHLSIQAGREVAAIYGKLISEAKDYQDKLKTGEQND